LSIERVPVSGSVGLAQGGIARPVAFEGAGDVLFHHLWLCEDEYWRMSRAFGRGRPLQRVYARLRRIVIMLDLTWTCQGEDPDGTTLRAIESLMTWNPALKKGMRLPLPAAPLYRAAIGGLAATGLPVSAQGALVRLRDLPEDPVDWWVTGESGKPLRDACNYLHDSHIVLGAIFQRLLDRISPTEWDWLEIAGEGIFKLMSFDNCDIAVAHPATGAWRRFNLPGLIGNRRLAMVNDPQALIKLEKNCVCGVGNRLGPNQLKILPVDTTPLPKIGSWICRPTLGQVVSIGKDNGDVRPWASRRLPGEKTHQGNDLIIGIRLVNGRTVQVLASTCSWTTLATPTIAVDPRRLARRIGLFIKVHEQVRNAGTEVSARLQPEILFRMPANLDRVVSLWVALHLDYLLVRSKLGKSIQPGGFLVFRRATALGESAMNSVRVFLLAQMRAEVAACGDAETLRLVAPLLHLARQAVGGPVSWAGQRGRRLRDEIIHACRGNPQAWARTSRYVSMPRIQDQWQYRLVAIADGRSLDELLIAWLFDISDRRYCWTGDSERRLTEVATFWHKHAAHRNRPRMSRNRRARD